MAGEYSRRHVLHAGVMGGVVGLAGCKSGGGGSTETSTPASTPSLDNTADAPVDVRGAIYVPTRAYNHFQTWYDYDPAVIERDLGYASQLNLNALRMWTSYMWWKEDPQAHAESLEHFISTAESEGMRVLVSLFDAVGSTQPWNRDLLTRTDPAEAVPAAGPLNRVIEDPDRWDRPREYVRWFMDRYRDDDRLLAIEAMNEPGWIDTEKRFAKGMFRTAKDSRGSVPLTMGATSLVHAADYLEWGADILQYHYNYPRSQQALRRITEDAMAHADRLDLPVWLSEWQRVRPSGGGFSGEIQGDEWQPKYRSMSETIREFGVGNFFWSLMVKPAFTPAQRRMGTVNGIFHEDGAVWSLDDARAIKATSGDPGFEAEERPERPDWMALEKVRTDGGESE